MTEKYLAYSHGLARLLMAAPNTTLTSKRTLNQILESSEPKFLLAFGDTLTLRAKPLQGAGVGPSEYVTDHLISAEHFALNMGVPADAIRALKVFVLGDV